MVNNFEDRYFKQLEDNFEGFRKDLRGLQAEVRQVNNRMAKLENKPDESETIQQLPSIWRDPKIQTVLLCLAATALVTILIIAGLTHTDVPKGILP